MMEEKSIEELRSMQEILEAAIQREELAYTFYLKAKEKSRTPAEAELFDILASEELTHKATLTRQLEAIQAQVEIDRALSYDVY